MVANPPSRQSLEVNQSSLATSSTPWSSQNVTDSIPAPPSEGQTFRLQPSVGYMSGKGRYNITLGDKKMPHHCAQGQVEHLQRLWAISHPPPLPQKGLKAARRTAPPHIAPRGVKAVAIGLESINILPSKQGSNVPCTTSAVIQSNTAVEEAMAVVVHTDTPSSPGTESAVLDVASPVHDSIVNITNTPDLREDESLAASSAAEETPTNSNHQSNVSHARHRRHHHRDR